MFSRVGAAACAAAVIVGVLAAPAETGARGGAVAIGHVGGFHPVVRSMQHVHQPFVHDHRAPLIRGAFAQRHGFHAAALRRHRPFVGLYGFYGFALPFTYADDGPFFGSYYDPSDVVGSLGAPVYAVPPAGVVAPVAERAEAPLDRGGCRSQTVAVPSPGGAEQSVTITRC
jgi:hypothetical protein